MATAKQTRRGNRTASPRRRKAPTSANPSLRKLYARLEKTAPGSEASRRISQRIVDSIG